MPWREFIWQTRREEVHTRSGSYGLRERKHPPTPRGYSTPKASSTLPGVSVTTP